MINEKMEKALNDQINEELYSSYLYLAMSAWFDSVNLTGFAHWMRIQSKEETGHAMKIFAYIHERGGKVNLKAIAEPAKEWNSPLAVFEDAYKHERHITDRINNLVDKAAKEKDYAANAFLQWFITEQVEEEASADDIVQKLKMIGDSKNGLFMLDRALASRS